MLGRPVQESRAGASSSSSGDDVVDLDNLEEDDPWWKSEIYSGCQWWMRRMRHGYRSWPMRLGGNVLYLFA
jgi:hypothetical protein